jgi:hypothetical protein
MQPMQALYNRSPVMAWLEVSANENGSSSLLAGQGLLDHRTCAIASEGERHDAKIAGATGGKANLCGALAAMASIGLVQSASADISSSVLCS